MSGPASEKSIFLTALEKESPAERSAYLDQVCATNTAMRAEIEALLAAHDRLDGLPPMPAGNFAPTIIPPQTEAPGTTIGPYKILEQIGEGGFGIVYMADQQAPVRRRVALKIIKPGMDTKQVLARFEAERQALALMEHPNIARALDAGATDTGRPYFVMELVRGIPITDYCDQNNLAVHERLNLFVLVCHAVQHAHQKGIIHRDIKPSNILVTMQDGRPVPKVIDFGVAKAINQQLTQETIFTRFAEMIGTPLYMSPEQAEMTSLDIDTRSDIYSLGVVLYELLTGNTPFEKQRLKQAAFDEIRRIIREEEPPKPSTRVSTLGDNSAIVAAHRHADPHRLGQLMRGDLDWIVMKALEKDRTRRYETANGLAMDVQRHLADEPVLAGPPSASYRFQKFARRNRKSLAMAVAITIALLLGIVGTTWQAIVATKERDRARSAEVAEGEQRREAETQRAQAEANYQKARAAVDEYFTLVSESKLFDTPGLHPLRKQLLESALRYYQGFLEQRSNDPNMRAEVAATHLRIAHIYEQSSRGDDASRALLRGLDIVQELLRDNREQGDLVRLLEGVRKGGRIGHMWENWPHDIPGALRAYQKAAAVWELLARENPRSLDVQSDLAAFYWRNGDLQWGLKAHAQALEAFQKASQIWEALARDNPQLPEYRADLAESLDHIGKVLMDSKRREESEAAYRKAMVLREKLVAEFPDYPDYRAGLANGLRRLGAALQTFGRPKEAEDAFRQSLAIWEKLTNEFPNFAAYQKLRSGTYESLGTLLNGSGRLAEAEGAFRQALDIREKLAVEFPDNEGDSVNNFTMSASSLSNLLKSNGRAAEADQLNGRQLQIISRAIDKLPKSTAPDDRASAELFDTYYQSLGRLLAATGKPDEAKKAYRQGADLMRNLAARFPDVPWYLEAVGHHRRLLAFAMSDSEAQEKEQAFREAFEVFAQLSDKHPDVPKYRYYLGDTCHYLSLLLSANKRFGEAVDLQRKCVDTFQKAVATSPDNLEFRLQLAHSHNDLATLLKSAGRFTEAEQGYRQAVTLKQKLVADAPANPDYRFHLAHSHLGLAYLFNDTGRKADAETAYRDALALWEKLVADAPSNADYRWNLAGNREALAGVLSGIGRKAEAESERRKALVLWEKLVAESPTNVDYRWHLAVAHDGLGNLLKDTGRIQQATEAYRQALPIWEELSAATHSDDHRLHLTWTRGWLIDVLLLQGNHAEAAKLAIEFARASSDKSDSLQAAVRLDQCAGLSQKDSSLTPAERKAASDKYAKQAAELMSEAGNRVAGNGELENGLAWGLVSNPKRELRIPTRAVELARKGVELAPTAGHIWNTLGIAQYRAGDWKAAVTALEKSMALMSGKAESFNTFFLAMAHWQLGQKDEARKRYDQAIAWMDKNAAQNDDLKRFRAEAADLLGLTQASTPKDAAKATTPTEVESKKP